MKRLAAFALASTIVLSAQASAQRSLEEVEVTSEEIAPGVAVLYGAGGNIGVSYGEDATVIIDDQFAELTEKIEAAVAELGAQPIKYVVNTHWHFDHVGGNEHFGRAGKTIFAHDNVRVRMAEGGTVVGNETPPAAKEALPIVTYGQGMRFHLNGDTINLMYLGGGHTDGDSVVMWEDKNVVHMGDLYITITSFPFVDVGSGGNVYNMMGTLDLVLEMIDNDTKVIPGHGAMSNKAELAAYRAMIGEAVERVEAMREEGASLADTVAAKPLASFDREGGFVSGDAFVTAIWNSMDD
ncbi:MBL fold metallo-hydrolase [Erythrobacter sp. THAF29]|uniref:MBL fold metallo-hydrolase n=1 Tax=Erythrobacter sp. THAF29 TaxID=2587851 RepID=UPI001268D20C|nr:MBL fold metallo-hydrolase [Erythrobacter sp. THAF29]QFT77895.1 Hydroxyacylglutathione hydrolase [Erythrobacter sp. THAF29]